MQLCLQGNDLSENRKHYLSDDISSICMHQLRKMLALGQGVMSHKQAKLQPNNQNDRHPEMNIRWNHIEEHNASGHPLPSQLILEECVHATNEHWFWLWVGYQTSVSLKLTGVMLSFILWALVLAKTIDLNTRSSELVVYTLNTIQNTITVSRTQCRRSLLIEKVMSWVWPNRLGKN